MPLNREYWWPTKQPQVTDLHWQLGFQWHRRGIELVFKSLDCFTKRLFHTATFFCCYICICYLKLHQADYKVEELGFFFFLPRFGRGALSSNEFTICAVYWSLGRRGYFGVSNVVLVNKLGPVFVWNIHYVLKTFIIPISLQPIFHYCILP